VTMRQVRPISRKDWIHTSGVRVVDVIAAFTCGSIQNPQRPYAEHRSRPRAVKIWSDLHGDMQSQPEMRWPPAPAGGNRSVGPYPMQP
jgi:hypothetical protein